MFKKTDPWYNTMTGSINLCPLGLGYRQLKSSCSQIQRSLFIISKLYKFILPIKLYKTQYNKIINW